MIPKVIHYCWFGRGEKSRLIKKCMRSWKKYCPDYEIIEWNEDNFDIDSTVWTREAYDSKKWAFVSDYVRLYVLYNYGGVYLDTDVEIKKPIDEFLKYPAFSGFEHFNTAPTGIIASEKNQSVIKDWLSHYDGRHYIVNGEICTDPNVNFMTNQLLEKGLKLNNEFQIIDGFAMFPKTYFCPLCMLTVEDDDFSENTYTVHHFTSTWRTPKGRKDLKRVRRHSTKWYRTYEKIAVYPIAAFNKIFRRRKKH